VPPDRALGSTPGSTTTTAGEDSPPDAERDGDVVVLNVGVDTYAVRALAVREVIPSPVVTPLPASTPVFLGVCNVRGDIVPILDTSALLGLGAGPSPTHVVIVRVPEGEVGLSTTGVPAFTRLGERVGDADVPGQVGAYRVANGIATLLELDVLVTRERLDGT
jgi:purine-binding chemotaxis protein CheW